jgi:hypothetical protein
MKEDKITIHNAIKKDFITRKNYPMNPEGLKDAVKNRPSDIKSAKATLLKQLEAPGMNIYKQVEMFKNYCPLVPVEL